jgi:hypothetical protein
MELNVFYEQQRQQQQQRPSVSALKTRLDALHQRALRVGHALASSESRAASQDFRSDSFLSAARNTTQLSDVINRLNIRDERYAWFVWRSIRNIVCEIVEQVTSRSRTADMNDDVTVATGTSGSSNIATPLNYRNVDDESWQQGSGFDLFLKT